MTQGLARLHRVPWIEYRGESETPEGAVTVDEDSQPHPCKAQIRRPHEILSV
jgi:hypothetical protein